ncbi:MAG: RNA helicase [Micrococcales bacterium 70-64]|nr:DEAD/DEAH box helicase [Leifsonia sp.]ODU63856.1 MAG: RNA helicase [Leifsonia sp. SCN 70-46]OJX85547.1 MAG: RNA helicase [Micrococcales bacterium 70-64]
MPNFSKKSYKSAAPKGAQREGHRGYRADAAAAAPKKRWTADDRAARTGDRPARGDDRRPDWTPREAKPARAERPAYGDRRPERPSYGDRPAYNDRPARPSYGDRAERPARPAYGDRPERPARPAYGERTERPAYGQRTERPSYGDRTERPRYERAERPARDDRPGREDRPRYERPERPARSFDRDDRAPRSYDRAERPAREDRPRYERPERPARSFDRDDRAPRSYDRAPRRDFDERPPRRESDYYTRATTSGPVEDVVLEKLEASMTTAGDVEGVTFADLGLGGNIVRQLGEMGAAAPFPIQAATIPDVLAGKDVLGRGKTGSGKTIAFGAPLVERLMENNGGKDRKMGRAPRALILAPTRELAQQIDRTVQPIARSVGLFTTTIVGGVPQYKQVSALQRGVDIIIATPGRVEDLVEQGRLDLSNVFVTVLDEADHMCDLGFLEPVQRILHETKPGGQKLLFSATLDKGVATLVNEFLVEPAVHEVAGEDQASSTIDHRVLLIEQRDKRAIIEQLASGEGKTLVFTRTRAFAEEMSDYLEDAGIPATSLHGDLNQSRRTRNLSLLTTGRVNVLVATDVAARGIHVDDISLVIQADAPEEYKTYLHRAGRTGRAGKKGTVVTLINRNRHRKMDELLGRAEIDATREHVAPGDAVLDELAAL